MKPSSQCVPSLTDWRPWNAVALAFVVQHVQVQSRKLRAADVFSAWPVVCKGQIMPCYYALALARCLSDAHASSQSYPTSIDTLYHPFLPFPFPFGITGPLF
jgi:hypothetical protein